MIVGRKKPLGLGHAIHCAKNLVGMEPFAVFLSDDVIDANIPVMKQMMKVFQQQHATILAVQQVPLKEVRHYGIIEAKKIGHRIYKVTDMVEKPHPKDAPSNLAIIGRYILTPEIFTALEETKPGKGGEIQLTDGLKLLSKKQPIYAYEFEGNRYDAGDKLGFLKANVCFALKNPNIKKEFGRFLKELQF